MSNDLSGLGAVVTGGNSGIGLGMAKGLLSAGAAVSVWGTNEAKNAAARATLAALAPDRAVHAARVDVSDEAAVEAGFDASLAALGRVDVVVVCAGASDAAPTPWDVSTEQWRWLLGVNLDGAFFTMRRAARHLVEQGTGGSIVVVSSTSSIHGAPFQPHYAASKTALLALTRSFAVGLARHKVRVNAVSPGWTDTDMLTGGKANARFVENTTQRTPVRRWADPDEFGAVAAYLGDPSLTFHTGDTLVVDGGYTIF